MNNIKKALILGLITFSAHSLAFTQNDDAVSTTQDVSNELEVKFGGWSFHSPKSEASKEDLNDQHLGLGVAYYPFVSKNERHRIGGEVWYMKDVFDNASFSAMASYKYRIDVNYLIDSIDLGFNLGLINDTERTYILDGGSYSNYKDESVTRLSASPQLTVNFTESIHVDVSYTSHDSYSSLAQDYDSVFFRFGYRFHL